MFFSFLFTSFDIAPLSINLGAKYEDEVGEYECEDEAEYECEDEAGEYESSSKFLFIIFTWMYHRLISVFVQIPWWRSSIINLRSNSIYACSGTIDTGSSIINLRSNSIDTGSGTIDTGSNSILEIVPGADIMHGKAVNVDGFLCVVRSHLCGYIDMDTANCWELRYVIFCIRRNNDFVQNCTNRLCFDLCLFDWLPDLRRNLWMEVSARTCITMGFAACFWYGDMLGYFFWVRGQFCLLQARRVFCAHFAIFDGLGSMFF